MSKLATNPIDAVLTLLRIGPDDNRWNLPEVRRLRAVCDELMARPAAIEPATFSSDEVEAAAPSELRPPMVVSKPEPVETEAERLARLAEFNRGKGRLL